MSIRRDGRDPSGYLGVVPSERPKNVISERAPGDNDRRYKIGTLWINKASNQTHQLTSVSGGTPVWTILGPGASDVDTVTGDSGGALSPTAGNINILGGTNMDVAGAGSTLTVNMDAAISLATSVTSPIYTTSAADMNINAAANQDILMQMGDAVGAQKISFEDSGSVEVASIDSDGAAIFTQVTAPIYTAGAGVDLNINAPSSQDIIMQMGDVAAGNKISFEDSASVEVASLDSNGNLVALGFFTSDAAAGSNLVGATLTADGSDANIDLTFVPKGTGDNLFTAGDINASAGDIIASRTSAAGDVTVECTNSDNTDPASDAFVEVAVGGTSGGNPGVRWQISGGQNYAAGIDNASAADDWLLGGDNDIGTDPLLRVQEAGDVTVEKGNLILGAVATQLQMNGGAATDFIGTATLSSGTITVANTNIAATDRIFIQRQDVNGSSAIGHLTYSISAATSFTITSVQAGTPASTETNDASIVMYHIIRQN